MVLVRARENGLLTLDLAGRGDKDLRLDQVGHLYDIVDQTRRGELDATQGLVRLTEMWATPPRFVRWCGSLATSSWRSAWGSS